MTNTSLQKIIKYFAIAFAFALIILILSCIMFGLSNISNFFSNKKDTIIDNLKDININDINVSVLDIDVIYTDLVVKSGNKLKVETNSKYITANCEENKLIIKETKHSLFNISKENDLIVYIPEDFIFDEVSIDVGSGELEINSLNTNKLEFNLGVGKTTINNLLVLSEAKIQVGAGKITISNSSINDLDLDTGIGKCTLSSKLIGFNEINVGIGELEVVLLGEKENYRVVVEKGIGKVKLEDEEIKSYKAYGTGVNSINISGGIGSIDIKFK